VKQAFVYEPVVTVVFAMAMVPEEVIGPPEIPVPVAMQVTVPLHGVVQVTPFVQALFAVST
jgi:hypothetical protein